MQLVKEVWIRTVRNFRTTTLLVLLLLLLLLSGVVCGLHLALYPGELRCNSTNEAKKILRGAPPRHWPARFFGASNAKNVPLVNPVDPC